MRLDRGDRALDPPVPNGVHDGGSVASQFLRYTTTVHGTDTLNFDVMHSLQTFQIPPDTSNGAPAATDDNEYQGDTYASLQYRHAIGDHGSLSFGPSFKVSRLLDTNDLANDLAGAAGGSCTDFSDCGFFSVFADRLARDYRFNADYEIRSPHHDVRTGVLYGDTIVDKHYIITLQPCNALNPSGGTFVATDTSPNVAHQQELYIQDSWKMGSLYQLDYGLRADSFQMFSTDFHNGFSQWSPRVKLTRSLGSRASVYAYYGRLFVPFSFENVSPTTAAALYVPSSSPGITFDLKPERDSLYEIGGHLQVGAGELGLRIWHKNLSDDLDDTQVGPTNLHQDINFPQGQQNIQSAYYQQPLARDGRFYLSLTHSMADNSANCETQLLQNCATGGPPGGPWTQADHDQRWDANGGILLNDTHSGWFGFNGEYGSGLSLGDTTVCPSRTDPDGNTINCKVPPHLVFNIEKGIAIGKNAALSVAIENLLNDRYAITLNSTLQGTHYATPRAINIGLRFSH
jgi:hypothetical protein